MTTTKTRGTAGAGSAEDRGAAPTGPAGPSPAQGRGAAPARPASGTGPARSGGSLLRQYQQLMAPASWRQLVRGLVLGAVNGAFGGLALLALLPASVALGTGRPSWGLGLSGWLVVLAVLALGAAASDFAGQRLGILGALGFMRDVHHAVGTKVATLPLSWFRSDSAGSLSRVVSQEMYSLGEAAAHFLYAISSSTASCVVIWAGAWLWDWRLSLLLTVAAPLMLLLLRWSRRLLDHGKSLTEPTERELTNRIVELARCQGALRSCRAGTTYPALTRAFDASARSTTRALWWESAGNALTGVLIQAIVVGMIVLTASLAVSGAMEPLAAVVTIGMCLRFTSMLENLGSNIMGIEERRQMINLLSTVMETPSLPEPRASAELTDPGAVKLDQVDFSYLPGTPVLRGLSLDVPAGSMCAVVGPSGSGKTTIARLVARFYDVGSGSVRVGGADVRELTTRTLMEQLSMVFQDVYLFDDTLDANIRVGDPQASDEQVRWAAGLAGVTEIVERLPEGWRTRVGEGGRALSGGERQRVAIARALLKRAPVVLLDEATSALDAENEANIVAAMEELRRTSTLVVIAHKLETIVSADQVVVLGADGRVAQRGSHADLVGVEGPYRDFWEYRNRARGWQLV